MDLGIYTFGDLTPDPSTGGAVSALERTRQMLEMARLADDAGLDIVGVGELHSLHFVNSATATILSAMAAVTKRIRLTSASTSISTADPVRTLVTDKILALNEALGATRYLGQIDIGGQPFAQVARGIELFATKVAPAVRKARDAQ
jgi:hypothetical protein